MSSGHELLARAKATHDAIRSALDTSPKSDRPTIVTVYSMNDNSSGQWIIGDESQDPLLVAQRLRTAADLLDGRQPL